MQFNLIGIIEILMVVSLAGFFLSFLPCFLDVIRKFGARGTATDIIEYMFKHKRKSLFLIAFFWAATVIPIASVNFAS